MEIQKPATPPNGATPGSTPNVIPTPSTTTPVVPEGKVIITTKEFTQLQRDAARGKSAVKRSALSFNKNSVIPTDESDPNAVAISEATKRAEIAERKALQMEVKGRITELLEKDEFKNIPKSTKAVILMNPALLTEADNLEEAMLDIEDFVRDQVLTLDIGIGDGGKKPENSPHGHDTPPIVNAGGAALVRGEGLEDLTKLRGPERSTAAIRNAIKSSKKGQ